MDLVWVDLEKRTIAFVELKKITDARLFSESGPKCQGRRRSAEKVRRLHPKTIRPICWPTTTWFTASKRSSVCSRDFPGANRWLNFELLEKPILLVGDCTQDWIDDHAPQINAKVSEHAFGSVYQGPSTFSFRVPY